MLDEPSLGLAPLIVKEIFSIIAALKASGVSILLVEQNARAALQIADHGYVLETGEVAIEGRARISRSTHASPRPISAREAQPQRRGRSCRRCAAATPPDAGVRDGPPRQRRPRLCETARGPTMHVSLVSGIP